MTELLQNNQVGIKRAVAIMVAGGVVAVPTDTIYGLSCDAGNKAAIAKIYTLKHRSTGKMLPVLVRDISQALSMAIFSNNAHKLAERFWPGGLTLVLPVKPDARLPGGDKTLEHLCLHDNTIAVRVAHSPTITQLILTLNGPIVVTSANISGQEVINNPTKIAVIFGPNLDAVLSPNDQDGISTSTLPSTVVRCVGQQEPEILRVGCITPQEIIASL